jgi:hypothetical protein
MSFGVSDRNKNSSFWTEQVGLSGNASDVYFLGSQFRSLPECQLLKKTIRVTGLGGL